MKICGIRISEKSELHREGPMERGPLEPLTAY